MPALTARRSVLAAAAFAVALSHRPAAACSRARMTGTVVMIDGAFDAAVQGTGLPITSPDELFAEAGALCEMVGLQLVTYGETFVHAWPSESMKLTQALRIAGEVAPIVLRLDSDETLTDESDLGALRGILRHGMHGATVTWNTIGEHAEGSQQPGAKPHLRAFAASPTLTAGPAYHGSYKVHDADRDEWLALRRRGDENSGLASGDLLDATVDVVIVNHPAERSPAMHEAKRRLLSHRYEGARSDR
jgi:hypothetical protein